MSELAFAIQVAQHSCRYNVRHAATRKESNNHWLKNTDSSLNPNQQISKMPQRKLLNTGNFRTDAVARKRPFHGGVEKRKCSGKAFPTRGQTRDMLSNESWPN